MGTQAEAIELVEQGENVFISGSAGVGKSYTIHQINDERTVLGAPTGVSALNIGGDTVHSLFGIPHGIITEEDKEQFSYRTFEIFGSGNVDRLIIDEGPMLRADALDLVDCRLRVALACDQPFGGIQTIIVGDPYQLPPIVTSQEKRHFRRLYRSPFFFNSYAWQDGEFESIVLDKVYRQEDIEQVEVLNKIRTKAEGWEDAMHTLNSWSSSIEDENRIVLCCYVKDADKINARYFNKLKTERRVYTGKKEGKFRVTDCIVNPEIELKVGARVIICANSGPENPYTYRNGQMGEILEFMDDAVVVALDSGQTVAVSPHQWERIGYVSEKLTGLSKEVEGTFRQIPLRLAYATSIHKAQGLTLDSVEVNLGRRAFAPHQTYVAISRVRNLRNMTLTRPIEADDIAVDSRVAKFYNTISS